jgi:hypothetical protein
MTRVSTTPTLSTPQRVLLVTLALAVFALNACGVYTMLTSRVQIVVWDFHPPWLGLRAMFFDGADPYSDDVTLAIQRQMLGRPARPDEDQFAFAYPLYVMVFIGPLALLPLPVAQALWFSLLEASLVTFIIVSPRAVGWRPPTWLLALTALFTLGLYPNMWAMFLGQNSIVVAALIALAWWGLRTRRWELAGACLALTTIKPQMIFLLVPGLLAWAIYQWHWRLVIAFGVTLGGLILLPLPWLPTWPLEWLKAVSRYAGYTIFDPPLVMLAGSAWLAGTIAVLLLAWIGYRWCRAPERQGVAFDWALSMIVVVSALIAPRITHVYQLMLLLPLFFVFTRLQKNGGIAVLEIGLLAGLWLIDLMLFPPTSSPQHVVWQHRFISPILPVGLALALLYFSPPLAGEEADSVWERLL